MWLRDGMGLGVLKTATAGRFFNEQCAYFRHLEDQVSEFPWPIPSVDRSMSIPLQRIDLVHLNPVQDPGIYFPSLHQVRY